MAFRLTLLLLPAGIGIILKRVWAFRLTPVLIYLLTGLAVLLVPLKLLPAFDQDNLLSMGLILPVLLINSLAWRRLIPADQVL